MLYGDKKHYNVMIVIPNKNFTADSIHLVQLLNSTTKVNMLKACDTQEWHMLMPSELTKALSTSLKFYLDMANKGVKAPSAKQLRMMSALGQFFGGKEL